jgi:hypothetical protein
MLNLNCILAYKPKTSKRRKTGDSLCAHSVLWMIRKVAPARWRKPTYHPSQRSNWKHFSCYCQLLVILQTNCHRYCHRLRLMRRNLIWSSAVSRIFCIHLSRSCCGIIPYEYRITYHEAHKNEIWKMKNVLRSLDCFVSSFCSTWTNATYITAIC